MKHLLTRHLIHMIISHVKHGYASYLVYFIISLLSMFILLTEDANPIVFCRGLVWFEVNRWKLVNTITFKSKTWMNLICHVCWWNVLDKIVLWLSLVKGNLRVTIWNPCNHSSSNSSKYKCYILQVMLHLLWLPFRNCLL